MRSLFIIPLVLMSLVSFPSFGSGVVQIELICTFKGNHNRTIRSPNYMKGPKEQKREYYFTKGSNEIRPMGVLEGTNLPPDVMIEMDILGTLFKKIIITQNNDKFKVEERILWFGDKKDELLDNKFEMLFTPRECSNSLEEPDILFCRKQEFNSSWLTVHKFNINRRTGNYQSNGLKSSKTSMKTSTWEHSGTCEKQSEGLF